MFNSFFLGVHKRNVDEKNVFKTAVPSTYIATIAKPDKEGVPLSVAFTVIS